MELRTKYIFEFQDLSTVAKLKAMQDYLSGWLETHIEDKNIDIDELEELLNNSDLFYNENGDYLFSE
jgi:hypothetical protein